MFTLNWFIHVPELQGSEFILGGFVDYPVKNGVPIVMTMEPLLIDNTTISHLAGIVYFRGLFVDDSVDTILANKKLKSNTLKTK